MSLALGHTGHEEAISAVGKHRYADDPAIPSRLAMADGLSFSSLCSRRISSGPIFGSRPVYTPRSLAAAIPSICRSRLRLVSNSADTPSMSNEALPAAADVSTGGPERDALALELLHEALEAFERAG